MKGKFVLLTSILIPGTFQVRTSPGRLSLAAGVSSWPSALKKTDLTRVHEKNTSRQNHILLTTAIILVVVWHAHAVMLAIRRIPSSSSRWSFVFAVDSPIVLQIIDIPFSVWRAGWTKIGCENFSFSWKIKFTCCNNVGSPMNVYVCTADSRT